jgi:hypothetical protein
MAQAPQRPSRAASIVRSLVLDGSFLGGAALLTYGAWLISPASGFLVPGFLLLALGVFGSRR